MEKDKGNILIKRPVDEQGEKLAVRERNWYQEVSKYNFKQIPTLYELNPLTMEKIDGKNIYQVDLTLDEKKIVIDNLIEEITDEYNITTVINTHDMNSVMEIGEKIVFLKNGLKAWEGTKEEIFRTDNEAVVAFVYSSNLFKKVREAYLKE